MKITLSWIKEFIDLDLPAKKIADTLTLAGLEVEGIESIEGDIIFDISLTPNLGHCMSIIGIASELSALLQLPLKHREFSFKETKCTNDVQISIKDQNCLRYCCRLVKDIKIGPSPKWLKNRLESCGVRSINNVIDIGNFVMLELGQPLHMFDYQKISEGKIVVQSGLQGTLTTLDKVERQISKEALMICDAKKPIAFAGVIGEYSSSVSDDTTDVLVEAAHFSSSAIRKTSKLLNLRTDSSQRFEKGIDPLKVDLAIDYAVQLLNEIAEGAICSGLVEITTQPYKQKIVEMDPSNCNRILGTQLSIHEIADFLKRLEMEILDESVDVIKVSIPSYRNDIHSEIDLIEEVGRIYGYNNIPRRLPRHVSSTLTHAPLFLLEEEVREKLIGQGLQECLTCDLISPKLANLSVESARTEESLISVLYPASIDQSILRPSLLPGLLEVVKYNIDRQNPDLALCEVGHIHFQDKGSFFGESVAAIILTGKSNPYHFENKPNDADFFDLKGYVENILHTFGLETRFEISHLHSFHPNRQAHIFIQDVMIGGLGQVHPKHCRTLNINQRVYYAEINLHDLMDVKNQIKKVKKLNNYPKSERDWTITIQNKISIGEIFSLIREMNSPILEKVFLLDLYKSDKIGEDRKNATFRFSYQGLNKTITYDEVKQEHERITSSIEKKLENVVL